MSSNDLVRIEREGGREGNHLPEHSYESCHDTGVARVKR